MKVLVTGGDGFVGQHLIRDLLSSGDEVIGTTAAGTPSTAEPSRGTLSPTDFSSVTWRHMDVMDKAGLERLLSDVRPETLYHLAGFSSGAKARSQAAEALEVNAVGTLHLLEAASAVGLEAVPVVVAGSADAYGRGSAGPIGERTQLRPQSPYGATKAAQDVVARGVGTALGLDVRVARIFPLVGPGQGEAFVLPSFCRRAVRIVRGETEPRLRVGNLDIERDFTDVRDGVRALILLGRLEVASHRAYNVCSGRGTAVRQLLDWVLEAAGVEPEIVVDPGLVRRGEAARVVGDSTRLYDATKWLVERDLRNAVTDTFRWIEGSDAS